MYVVPFEVDECLECALGELERLLPRCVVNFLGAEPAVRVVSYLVYLVYLGCLVYLG